MIDHPAAPGEIGFASREELVEPHVLLDAAPLRMTYTHARIRDALDLQDASSAVASIVFEHAGPSLGEASGKLIA